MAEMTIGKTRLQLVRGDITQQSTDAIVNAANSSLLGGGGVDGAIHHAGGPSILAECREIRRTLYPDPSGMPTGKAVITTAGRMPSRFVIHTVGPVWHGGGANESVLLADAYRNGLQLAVDRGLRSIAFPSISTGVYGYPVELAARVAFTAILDFMHSHPDAFDEVRMVLFSERDKVIYEAGLSEVSRHAD